MDKIIEAIIENSKNNRISCSKALEIAEKLGVKPKEVGKKLDEQKIKIIGCQLGCFK